MVQSTSAATLFSCACDNGVGEYGTEDEEEDTEDKNVVAVEDVVVVDANDNVS